MRTDARALINQKRKTNNNNNKRPTNMIRKGSRGIIDARSILNSKLGQKSRVMATTSFSVQGSKRSTPSNASSFQIPCPQKHVKIARDGNIVVTAKSKEKQVFPYRAPRWTPPDVETANLETLGIDDVLDMDSLPSTVIGMNKGLPKSRSLAEEIVDMQDTMIADQVSTLQQQQPSVCVYISNLHVSVSKQDIAELFGDIGLVKRVEMTQPGAALVEFFDSNDAVKACELYHQRLLDGQPMMCQVQPSKRSLISQRLGERVEPHFPPSLANSRSIYNPHNVRFTVKLS